MNFTKETRENEIKTINYFSTAQLSLEEKSDPAVIK